MDSERIGPKLQVIPEQRYMSCSGCKFYDYHMIKSGRHPVYARDCRHSNIPEQKKFDGIWGVGNLGDDRSTPDWCPELKKQS